MRALRMVAAFLAVLLSPQIWPPVWGAPTPTFSISSPSANAGQPEVFTITRVSGGSGAYVLFQTHDGTAHAGVDYTATSQLVYVKAGVTSVTVSVPTAANPAATGNLTFTAVIASTRTPFVGTATIVEPAAPPPPSPPAASWTKCADENGSCAFVPPADVRYGAGTLWFTKSLTTSPVACDNQTWGDPNFGVVKECDTTSPVPAPPPPPPPAVTWTKCATETQWCYVIGTANVRYGTGSIWTAPRPVTGSIFCDNSVFGDPDVGFVKECDTDGQVGAAPAPAPTPTPTPTPAPVPTTNWIAAPLTVGGYACNKAQAGTTNVPPCGQGIVYKIIGAMMSSDAQPVQQYAVQFYSDASGQFPASDSYDANFIGIFAATDLQGLAPAP